MRRIFILCCATVFAAIGVSAETPSREQLLGMLRSGDAHQRAIARQLLPRESVERIGDIVAMLGDPNEPVWRAVSNVLTDVANEVSAPGREADRRHVSDVLLARLAQRPGPEEAARLLNIVHLVLPEGADVAPIAHYLNDDALRMNARNALQLADTAESKRALRSALEGVDGLFALAVIDSLGMLRDRDAKPVLVARLDDRHPAVRAAAARALAWTGDADLIAPLQRVAKSAPGEHTLTAGDAVLALGDAILARGGRYDTAMDLYVWAARELEGAELRGAALASMGRRGDERVVPVVIDAARRAPAGMLDHAALEALAVAPGEAVSRVILVQHDALLKQFGPSIYGVYGRRGDAAFTPVLIGALETGDPYARHAASLALLDAGHAEGITAVAKHAATLDEEPRAMLSDAIALIAARSRRDGRADVAGAAYAGLYRLAATDEARNFALDGMMRYPSEDAFAIVKDLIGQQDLNSFSVPFLAGIARALIEAKRPEEANGILDAIVTRLDTSADVQSFLQLSQGAGAASRLGFILKWHVVGPFPWSAADRFETNHLGAADVDLSATYAAGNGERRTWAAANASDGDGILNLIGVVGNHSNAVAYAYAEITVPEACEAVLRLGSDDGVKAWVNGEVVHEHHVDRGLAQDQDRAKASLAAGTNGILIEVTQGAGGWMICARLTDREGRPLKFEP